jgi:ligand-binding sensor domain-containing protein
MSAGDLPSCRHLLRAPWLCTLLLMLIAGAHAEQLPVKLYTTADGLWSSNTTCLMRDSHGFVWFCTREGVSRFDGYRFVNYRIGSEPGSQHVSQVLETRDGIFWFVMNRGGLYRYDPSIPSPGAHEATTSPAGDDGRIPLPAQLVSRNLLQFLYEDHKGNLWAGYSGLSLIEDRTNNISFRQIKLGVPQGPDELLGVSAPAEGSDGSLWLSTSRGLIRRLPDGQTIRFNLGPQNLVATSLAVDGKDRLWIGYSTALYVLQMGPPPSRPASVGIPLHVLKAPHNMASLELALGTLREGEALDLSEITRGTQVHQIYPHSNGQIWIAIWRSVLLFDGGHFHRYVLGHDVGWFAEDLDGELWMGGPTGVMKLSLEGMVSYRTDDGLIGIYILSFYGRVRLTGFFPTRPLRISFDLIFQSVNGQWRLFAVSVATPEAPATQSQIESRPPRHSSGLLYGFRLFSGTAGWRW